jgi:hypothetical protein
MPAELQRRLAAAGVSDDEDEACSSMFALIGMMKLSNYLYACAQSCSGGWLLLVCLMMKMRPAAACLHS